MNVPRTRGRDFVRDPASDADGSGQVENARLDFARRGCRLKRNQRGAACHDSRVCPSDAPGAVGEERLRLRTAGVWSAAARSHVVDAVDGRVRAVISTGAKPVSSSLAPAIEDPIKLGKEWLASLSISPVNHVLVTSEMSFKKWSGAIWDFADSLRAHALSSASAPAWASGDALMGERPNSECFSFSNIAESAAFFVTHCLAQGVINKPVDVSKSMAKGR